MGKKWLVALVAVGLALPCGAAQKGKSKAKSAPKKGGNPVIVMETTQGTIEVELDLKSAPKTCENFVKLVKEKFYDGIVFHRYEPGFVVQGGDPYTKKDPNDPRAGTGGPGYTVPAEIKLPHRRGTLAMARLGDAVNPKRESSGSQFYICLADDTARHLDGAYTAFGKVVKGMEVVDKLRKGDKIKKATVKAS